MINLNFLERERIAKSDNAEPMYMDNGIGLMNRSTPDSSLGFRRTHRGEELINIREADRDAGVFDNLFNGLGSGNAFAVRNPGAQQQPSQSRVRKSVVSASTQSPPVAPAASQGPTRIIKGLRIEAPAGETLDLTKLW